MELDPQKTPFLAPVGRPPMLNAARIKEGVMIAALAGFLAVGATWIIAIPVIQADQAALRQSIERIEHRLERRLDRMEERMLVPAWERERSRSSARPSSPDAPRPDTSGAPMPMMDNRVGVVGRRDP